MIKGREGKKEEEEEEKGAATTTRPLPKKSESIYFEHV